MYVLPLFVQFCSNMLLFLWSLSICPYSHPLVYEFVTFFSWNTFPYTFLWLFPFTLGCYSNVIFSEKLFLYSLSILHPLFIILHRTYVHVKLYISLFTPLLEHKLYKSRNFYFVFVCLFSLHLYP